MTDQPMQTTPTGAEIPVPERGEVLAAFRKAAKVPASPSPSDDDE